MKPGFLIYQGYWDNTRLKTSTPSKALLSFKTVRIDDLTTDTLLDAMLRERLIAQGYISFVSCPIQIRSGKLGLICCTHCYPPPMGDD